MCLDMVCQSYSVTHAYSHTHFIMSMKSPGVRSRLGAVRPRGLQTCLTKFAKEENFRCPGPNLKSTESKFLEVGFKNLTQLRDWLSPASCRTLCEIWLIQIHVTQSIQTLHSKPERPRYLQPHFLQGPGILQKPPIQALLFRDTWPLTHHPLYLI